MEKTLEIIFLLFRVFVPVPGGMLSTLLNTGGSQTLLLPWFLPQLKPHFRTGPAQFCSRSVKIPPTGLPVAKGQGTQAIRAVLVPMGSQPVKPPTPLGCSSLLKHVPLQPQGRTSAQAQLGMVCSQLQADKPPHHPFPSRVFPKASSLLWSVVSSAEGEEWEEETTV